MAFVNVRLDIIIGNLESQLVGPVPRQLLDRELNPHLARVSNQGSGETERSLALVYNPSRNSFLTGALPRVKRLLKSEGIRFRLRDVRSRPRPRFAWRLHKHELRAYQEEVVKTALSRGCGLIDIGTGGGKTPLAASIIARLGLPTLYLVTTRTLLEQAARNLQDYLNVEPGVIGDGVRRPNFITVALVQSLGQLDEDLSLWADGALIFDEGHHAAAATYLDLVKRVNARYNFFLSAVPFRTGEDQAVLDALTQGSLTGGAYSARYLIENDYACPVEVCVEHIEIKGEMGEKNFATLYAEFIVNNEERNRRIARRALGEIGEGKSVLVLVERIRHGEMLHRLIGEDSAFVHGGVGKRTLAAVTSRFVRGAQKCLIATAGLFQEGVSIDGIQVLIQAGGLKSKVKVIQAIGRGMRSAPGKRSCKYVDFWDDDAAGVLRSHSRERVKALKAEGFHIPTIHRGGRPPGEPLNLEIPPTWAHVPSTNIFALVNSDGEILDRELCICPALVPEDVCRRCMSPNNETCTKKGVNADG